MNLTPDFILHIGAGKCGSSAIQRAILDGEAILNQNGISVAKEKFPDGNMEFGNLVSTLHNLMQLGKNNVTEFLYNLKYSNPRKSILISAENLSNLGNHIYFKEIAKQFTIKCIFYVRRQDEYLESSWVQWGSKIYNSFHRWVEGQLESSARWDLIWEDWSSVVGAENVEVRIYDRNTFENRDIVNDFNKAIFSATGLDIKLNSNGEIINSSIPPIVSMIYNGDKGLYNSIHDEGFDVFINKLCADLPVNYKNMSIISPQDRVQIFEKYEKCNTMICKNVFKTENIIFTSDMVSSHDDTKFDISDTLKIKFLKNLMIKAYELYGINQKNKIYSGNTSDEINDSFLFDYRVVRDDIDREFYLSSDKNLTKENIDPAWHYVTNGWKEYRDPNLNFSTRYYLDNNMDVKESGINPFVHYILYGKEEGRQPSGTRYVRHVNAFQISNPDRNNDISIEDYELAKNVFNVEYYLSEYRDIKNADIDPLWHFMLHGWKEHRNPNPYFSTAYYLENNQDIRDSGINPLLHFLKFGRYEGRNCLPYAQKIERRNYAPFVSVIIPNFNHAKYLPQRIECIISQTYQNFEIIILDDLSTDSSRKVIDKYVTRYPEKITAIYNEQNSGNIFRQWRRGIESAKGELLWICESDDYCDVDFLGRCIRPLADESVTISFGRIQFCDETGKQFAGLDAYRNRAFPDAWETDFTISAAEAFKGPFAISNIIPNVGGCVFRNQHFPDDFWSKVFNYKVSGDWLIYLYIANGGRLAFVKDAIAYFRQHTSNTSVTSFSKPHYYTEHERLMQEIRHSWDVPDHIVLKFGSALAEQFRFAKAKNTIGSISKVFSNDRILQTERKNKHILMCIMGFHLGGGEIFPIHLANCLNELGYIVSIMCQNTEGCNPKVRSMLHPHIAVYDTQFVGEVGVDRFIEEYGIDIIHSHNAGLEFFFFNEHRITSDVPYVVTLHGSYEVTYFPDDVLLRILKGVDHWVYLSDKNLFHFKDLPINKSVMTRIANGMPVSVLPSSHTRENLGFANDDIVFMIAARAIPEKGMKIAVEAIKYLEEKHGVKNFKLMLCGDGPDYEELILTEGKNENIRIMGFQDNIPALYQLADVALLPTRFAGESYPLSLIQAMQAGLPIVSTDIGEISIMLGAGEAAHAGIMVQPEDANDVFIEQVAEAMLQMKDKAVRQKYGESARSMGEGYDIQNVCQKYLHIFNQYWDVPDGLSPGNSLDLM